MDVLKLNPELSLGWNFRREIISREQDDDTRTCVMRNELAVLNAVMVDKRMTKSYCLWNHRRWLVLQLNAMSRMDDQLLADEVLLIKTILRLDSRNFHSWSYRHWLRSQFPSLVLEDVQYSQSLIEADFSNYSAWFLRRAALDKEPDIIDGPAELDMVWNAIFTEPTDQSCWQYHDWLLEREPGLAHKDSDYCQELEAVVDEKDAKYLLLWKLKQGKGGSECVDRLMRIDPMRKGYYSDLLKDTAVQT